MKNRISVASILLLFVTHLGCGRTVSVAVLDGDTKKPIAGAKVLVDYQRDEQGPDLVDYTFLAWFRAYEDAATTNAKGVARVRVRRPEARWTVDAPGYLEHSDGSREFVPEGAEVRRVDEKDVYAVLLYREPMPQVWIILPDGYHGLVRITERLNISSRENARELKHEFHASGAGDVEIQAAPLLHEILADPANVHFRYASGQGLPRIFPPAPDLERRIQPGVPPVALIAVQPAQASATLERRFVYGVGNKEIAEISRFYESIPPQERFEAVWNKR